jgi:hypothetical protein
MVHLVNQPCPDLQLHLRDVPQSLAAIVVGSQMIGKLYSHGQAIPKVQQGWLLLNMLQKQKPAEPEVWHLDEYEDNRMMIKEILKLADGQVQNHILSCLAFVVRSSFLFIRKSLFLKNHCKPVCY